VPSPTERELTLIEELDPHGHRRQEFKTARDGAA
jgi:hypothetical protein